MNRKNMTLVVGGTGKTGRKVAARLGQREVPFRIGSRSGHPAFDWEDRNTWAPALEGATAAYITYYPDLAMPGADEAVRSFSQLAVEKGVQRLVLLSGRGEEGAQRGEQAVRESGAEWTIVRASFFCQNFSEGPLADALKADQFAFPAKDVKEPFIDVEDIADVATAALTEDGHAGQVYEVTGPRLMTFADAIAEISRAAGRKISYAPVSSEAYQSQLVAVGFPLETAAQLVELFATVLDGRNAHLADGVQRALGRKPVDFADYARVAAASGVWRLQ